MSPTNTVHVDLDAVAHNHAVLTDALERAAAERAQHESRASEPGSEGRARTGSRGRNAGRPGGPAGICAVLKADGYGLGAVRLAKKLAGLGLDLIAVYNAEEARELLSSHLGVPILVLMPVHGVSRDDKLFHALSRGLIHLTVHDEDGLASIGAVADKLGLSVPVHVAVDTGMSRAGSPPGEAAQLIDRVLDHPRLHLAGVATHFASADGSAKATAEQLAAFEGLLARYDLPWERRTNAGHPETERSVNGAASKRALPANVRIHAANSFAALRSGATHFTTVRLGIALLGYGEEEFGDPESFAFADVASRLKPAARWSSRIVQIKRIAGGTAVGYGGTWRTPTGGACRLGTVPVGYADGYPRSLSSEGQTGWPRAHVTMQLADGQTYAAPVVGRVSMDQITVDLSAIPESLLVAGQEVDVVSCDREAPNHLPKLAAAAGTITHELLCRLVAAPARRYVSSATTMAVTTHV